MEGICCAAEIRSAYFIGTGNISSARITSYKSLMIGENDVMLNSFLVIHSNFQSMHRDLCNNRDIVWSNVNLWVLRAL